MSKNRFRPSRWLQLKMTLSDGMDAAIDLLVYLRPLIKRTFFFAAFFGMGWGVFGAAQRSPYFRITSVRVENANRVERAQVMKALQLDAEANYFKFDPLVARKRLLEHDWIADAEVQIHLPNRLTVRLQERRPVAVVALGSLYLVDAEGKVFAAVTDVESIPNLVITGLDKETLKTEPEAFKATVRTALSLHRLYNQSIAAPYASLDSIHVDESGRWELMLGSTHVTLGDDRFEDRLAYLGDVLRTLDGRKAGADYIMLAPELNRAIVKERPLDKQTTKLSLGTKLKRGEKR